MLPPSQKLLKLVIYIILIMTCHHPNIHLSNEILCDSSKRYCEIYKIQNKTTDKVYVGQAVSHILNHNKYRPYGHIGRFKTHISEAFSTKKHQSHYLNNAIRKYGKNDFTIVILEYCDVENANEREKYHIISNKSIFPYGYNLKIGGQSDFTHSDESRKRVSDGLINHYRDTKYIRFKDIQLSSFKDNVDDMIKPLNRYNIQYGWYVYINKIKTDFGGVHITLEESKNMAVEFIYSLKKQLLAKHLVAGNPLEPLLPLSDGNICEELV